MKQSYLWRKSEFDGDMIELKQIKNYFNFDIVQLDRKKRRCLSNINYCFFWLRVLILIAFLIGSYTYLGYSYWLNKSSEVDQKYLE